MVHLWQSTVPHNSVLISRGMGFQELCQSDLAFYRIRLFQIMGEQELSFHGLIWKAPEYNIFHGAQCLLAGKQKNKSLMWPGLWFRRNEMAQTQKLRPESCNAALKGSIWRDYFPYSGKLSLNCIGLLPGEENLILWQTGTSIRKIIFMLTGKVNIYANQQS